ncbi:MAG: ATP-binding protein [Ignavibacteriales bacterium]|nr:ATP-binding protein [Ignavibacteriales bacterium]
MQINTIGTIVDKIPVEISYRIIELFSAGLYSSPNKAFEELVTNSYDAGATKVCVYVPTDKSLSDSVLWVCDNGESMDKEGLKLFWQIGSSKKRELQNTDRLVIGRFGIGKLATYILTNKLTVLCKASDGKYHAVTMNYTDINQDSSGKINLDERELTIDEVKTALGNYISIAEKSLLSFELWGEKAEKTWTFVLMSDLKVKAHQIQDGRLQWILSTALPMNPFFNLTYNGSPIISSKEKIKIRKSYVFGENDLTAIKFKYETGVYRNFSCVNFENLPNVYGQINLYEESLLQGKSGNHGRSHGVFLYVRERLINIDEPLLPNMSAMFHGVFNRVQIIVHADFLDDYITSTREAIKESEAYSQLKKYLERKFDEVKKDYLTEIEAEENKNKAANKIAYAAASLSRRPILVAARKYFDGEIDKLYLTKFPTQFNDESKTKLLSILEERLTDKEGIIRSVEWAIMDIESPLAIFDIESGCAKINLMHPFFANYTETTKSLVPFELVALTEILTECILVENGDSAEVVRDIMSKRDAIFRELTFSDKPNAPVVAQLLQSTVGDSTGLEEAVNSAFNSLGFQSNKIGGTGKPDGLAQAVLGPMGSTENYSVTFDAKSTSKNKIQATTAHISGVKRHRHDYHAEYCCIVAIDFEGALNVESAINKEAKSNQVSLIRIKDLIALVLLASPKQLGLGDLRDFFQNCHTVIETHTWIEKLGKREVQRGPIKELLETVFEFISKDKEQPNLNAIRVQNPVLKKFSVVELRNFVTSLAQLVPGYISLHNDVVSLQTKPEIILKALQNSVSGNLPLEFQDMYLKNFGE